MIKTETTEEVAFKLAQPAPNYLPAVAPGTPRPFGVEACPQPMPTGVSKIAGAIAAVMAEVGTVTKRGENQFHHYQYARMQDILQQLTPLLGKHGLVIFQDEIERSMFDNDNVIAIKYRFEVAHSSGEIWPRALHQTGVSRCRDSKGGWDDKSLNKCHTAARKYFLLALFQIPTGEEDDETDSDASGGSHANAAVATEMGAPHAIRVEKGGAKAWTKLFLVAIRQAETADVINEWVRLNEHNLEQLQAADARKHKIVVEATERRRGEVASATPGNKPLPPLVSKPAARKDEMPDIPDELKVKCPDPVREPLPFLHWIDARLKRCISVEDIQLLWDAHVSTQKELIFPRDYADLKGMFDARTGEILNEQNRVLS